MYRPAAILLTLTAALVATADEPADLDVTRIALFNSGVGYFECTGEVSGDATAELKFRTDQINDILKSLVVQDFGGGSIGVVSYASQDPIEKTLRSFGVDITGKPTLGELLDQLRGEPVEVAAPRALQGVIVGVEKKRVIVENNVVESDVLNLLTDTGLEQIELGGLRGIRLTSEKVDAELRKALATLATGHDADKKSVLLRFNGAGRRTVRAAYLLEAPVWKTSYRLVLSDDKKPFLQGWATVENATEEDWNDVRLSLVSGRPISFRMDLYTPLYVPRPLEQMELYASLRPPDYEGAMEERTERFAGARLKARAAAKPSRGGRSNSLIVAGDVGALAEELGEEWFPQSLYGTGVESVATAQEAGELFEYVIKTPVSIPRQHSAMLPIVNEEVAGEKVSIYNPATHRKYPLNGLELTNATKLNLMQGPVTLFDGDVYAGDAKLPDLKPGEKRLVAYALDLATEVFIKQKPTPEELVSLRITKGVLWHRHKYVDQRDYVIKNKAAKQRTVLLEQPYSEDWKPIQPAEPYERTANLLRFKVSVPPTESVTYPVQLERIGDQSIVLMSAGLDDIRFYLRTKVITPALREALERVVALRTELDDLARQRANLEKSLKEVVDDQGRIRENLRTLQRDTDAYQRQLTKFDELETQIEQLRSQLEQARQAEEQKRKQLEQYLLSLNVE